MAQKCRFLALHWGRHPLALQQTGLFLNFPCVCPEPVLVKSSFLYMYGYKRPFCYLGLPSICKQAKHTEYRDGATTAVPSMDMCDPAVQQSAGWLPVKRWAQVQV
jgi:hypothetical protein